MFSSAVVSDGALTKAADALKANGVEGVTSQTSVDPITELKVVPGIDTSKLQTLDKEAAEAAAAAPEPPPPKLVLDDDDFAVGLGGRRAVAAASACALAVIALLR